MAASATFWDKIAAKYAAQPIADQQAYEYKLEQTRKRLLPAMQVLEIGCGTGGTAIAHAPHVAHIRAVDISKEMIAIAQAKAADAHVSNVSFETSAVDDLAVADESVDAVLTLSLLHLLEDKEAVIKQIHRALKPGGLFVSSTVCLKDYAPWIKYVVPIGRFLGKMPLVKVISAEELTQTILSNAFEIEHSWHPSKNKALFLIARKTA